MSTSSLALDTLFNPLVSTTRRLPIALLPSPMLDIVVSLLLLDPEALDLDAVVLKAVPKALAKFLPKDIPIDVGKARAVRRAAS